MKKFFKIIISFLFLAGLNGFNSVQAAIPFVPCGEPGNPCHLCHLWLMADIIINFLVFDFAIPLSAILFIAAGVILLISAGNQNRIDLAKEIFTNTLIGLVIVFASWLLIDTLLTSIASGGFSGAWNEFPPCP
jgi:hypothetical protein